MRVIYSDMDTGVPGPSPVVRGRDVENEGTRGVGRGRRQGSRRGRGRGRGRGGGRGRGRGRGRSGVTDTDSDRIGKAYTCIYTTQAQW